MKTEADTSGVHIWLVLWKATRAVEAHALRSIDALGICRSDFAILEVLLHKGPQPIHAIGKKILLTSGSLTTAVDRLEKKGLVERSWEHADRRVCEVHLTPEGRRLIARAFRDHAATLESVAAGLATGERAQLLGLLKKLGFHARSRLGPGHVSPPLPLPKTKKTTKKNCKPRK